MHKRFYLSLKCFEYFIYEWWLTRSKWDAWVQECNYFSTVLCFKGLYWVHYIYCTFISFNGFLIITFYLYNKISFYVCITFSNVFSINYFSIPAIVTHISCSVLKPSSVLITFRTNMQNKSNANMNACALLVLFTGTRKKCA